MSFEVVCFDCDSTLSKIEGIDELASRIGIGAAMAKLTDAAMNGEVPLEEVYEKRLSLIGPNRESIDWLGDLYIERIVDGVKQVFETLAETNKELHIVSGGIRQAILPLAKYLDVPEDRVHAVDIYFNDDGSYRDFDRNSPLARSGGKAEVCKHLLEAPGSLVMIGDGKTDMEAKQAGAVVVGFGGVADRALVREQADFYTAEPSLLSILTYIL